VKKAHRKRLWSYIAENKWRFLGSMFFGALVAAIDLYTAHLLNPFIEAAKGGSTASQPHAWGEICRIAAIFVLIQIPKGFSNYWMTYLVASATNHIGTRIRNELYSHLQRMSLSYFERNKVGHLMSRMTNDVGLIQNGSAAVVDSIIAPLMIVGGIARMFMINWILAIVAIIFAPGMGWIISKVTRRMRKLTVMLQAKLAEVASVFEETIVGIRIVKSFGMEAQEVKRFVTQSTASLAAALKAAKRNAMVTPIVELVGALAVAVVVLVGGYMVVTGRMTFGSLAEFAMIGFYVSGSAKKVGRLNVVYHQTMAGVERVFEVLDEQPDMVDADDAVSLDHVEGRVEFRDVSFSYQTGEQVLNGISFVIEPGKVVAIVGPSGAGKTTVANVIPRFYDVTSGAVLVDGFDVRKIKTESLRKHITIVPQETILFSGTVRENIAYGKPDATDEEIEQAARAANAHDFITKLEDGYLTVIGERGVRLSGGERQRISIARAILKDPRILILDEATSSLDTNSERLVQDALERLMNGRTTLVIAHRLSTITKADNIIVLGDGKIIEQGTFDELMSREGVFAHLYRAQYDLQSIGGVIANGGRIEETVEKDSI